MCQILRIPVEQDRQISYSVGLTIWLERGVNIQIKKNMSLNNKYVMKIKQGDVIKMMGQVEDDCVRWSGIEKPL